MNIDTHILQKFVDGNGRYFLCQRRTSFGARGKADETAWLISPTVPANMLEKKVEELPYFVVHDFARSYVIANISIGERYAPFQQGISYGEFVFAEEVTCNIMDFVIHCHTKDITDYMEATKAMKQLTEDEKPL